MSTLLVTHPDCLAHEVPEGHPERPDRLRAIDRALSAEAFLGLVRQEAPLAKESALGLVHPEHHILSIKARTPREGFVDLDSDTMLSPGTWTAALRSAGGAVQAVDEVMSGRVRNAFVSTRPPGHHAERETAMGFCYFNNAAIAARYAKKVHGIDRVAIVDFDVHHGNGTQDIFWSDPDVMYCSSHEAPLYPGSGSMSERGDYDQIINMPLPPGTRSEAFREAYDLRILPQVRRFAPQLIVISAGFDGHIRDPLANFELQDADFAWVTMHLMEIADRFSGGRVVSVLEGGYDLQGLASGVSAHVLTLLKG
jgi:acetoin utilization deacetylase AcuC-like enzyme